LTGDPLRHASRHREGSTACGVTGGGADAFSPPDPPADFVFDREVETFLAVCRTASLATVGSGGLPHNANVQFAHGGGAADGGGPFDLWWVSSPASDHSKDLAARAYAAVTVYAHADAPDQIRGVQARGRVQPPLCPGDAGYAAALRRYVAKYPFAGGPPFNAAVARQGLYRFCPDWIRWIDNRRGFGWKVERSLKGSAHPSFL